MPNPKHIQPVLQNGCAQPYLAIRLNVCLSERHSLAALSAEVAAYIKQQGLKIAGPLFCRYWVVGSNNQPCQLEIGYPVCTTVLGNERVVAGAIPNGTFATLVHCGKPGMLGDCFNQLENWLQQNGLCPKILHNDGQEVWAGRFEFYLNSPPDDADQTNWRTAVALLVEDGQ